MKILAIFLLIAAATAQQNPDQAQFLAQVIQQVGTGDAIVRNKIALAVLHREKFFITAATAVQGIDAANLHLYLRSSNFQRSDDIRQVTNVHVHPQFSRENPLVNNIAILEIAAIEGDAARRLVSRNIAGLRAIECRVFSFPAGPETVLTSSINVVTANCANNQTYCATLQFPVEVSACPHMLGSPVVCENFEYVSGFVNDALQCAPLNGIPITGRMTFTNIWPHRQWIRDIAGGAEMTTKVSLMLLLLSVITAKFLM